MSRIISDTYAPLTQKISCYFSLLMVDVNSVCKSAVILACVLVLLDVETDAKHTCFTNTRVSKSLLRP